MTQIEWLSRRSFCDEKLHVFDCKSIMTIVAHAYAGAIALELVSPANNIPSEFLFDASDTSLVTESSEKLGGIRLPSSAPLVCCDAEAAKRLRAADGE